MLEGMSFTLDQIRSFVVVAEEEHFGRAAERLGISQPPLSRQIQLLERSLGTELFDRTRRATRLTPAGEGFFADITKALDLISAAKANATKMAEGISGQLDIGFTLIIGNVIVPQLLRLLAEQMPGISLILHEMTTADIPRALDRGTIDLGLCRPVAHGTTLESLALPNDQLIAAVPKRSPIASKLHSAAGEELPRLPVALFEQEAFVAYATNGPPYFKKLVDSIFTLHGIVQRPVQEIAEVYTILRLVDSGIGSALVPSSTASWAGDNTQLCAVPELRSHPIRSVATWSRENRHPCLHKVIDLVAQLA